MVEAPLVLIVGVCASGKTTLSTGLRKFGYNARSLAQEHSVSPRLWQYRRPDFLILLHCEYSTIKQRKQISWGPNRYEQQLKVLQNARESADLIVYTDDLSPQELVSYVDSQLRARGIYPTRRSNNGS